MTNRNLLGICLGFFCFDYYWYFLVNWLPDYLVTSRGLTMMTAGIYAALPFFVFGVSEPIGGWIADRLIVAGWNETGVAQGHRHVRIPDRTAADSRRARQQPGRGRALIIGGCLVGLATGNLLVSFRTARRATRSGSGPASTTSSATSPASCRRSSPACSIARTGSYAPPFVLAAALIALGPLALWLIVGRLTAAGAIIEK